MGSPNISGILQRAKEIYDDIHDQWLNSNIIGVNVNIYYPPTYVDCSNCVMGPYGTMYRAGGPAPFMVGSCPVCGTNTCKKEVEHYDTIKLRIYSINPTSFSRSAFKKLGISIDQPTGDLLTIGFLSDVPKLRSCNYAVFYENQQSKTGSLRYKLISEPIPHGFGKDRYFYCFWERI